MEDCTFVIFGATGNLARVKLLPALYRLDAAGAGIDNLNIDLMHGLPLQSVFSADGEAWHQPLRLLTVVQAPREFVLSVVQTKPELQRLFANGWVTLACIDPQDGETRLLHRNLSSWQTVERSA